MIWWLLESWGFLVRLLKAWEKNIQSIYMIIQYFTLFLFTFWIILHEEMHWTVSVHHFSVHHTTYGHCFQLKLVQPWFSRLVVRDWKHCHFYENYGSRLMSFKNKLYVHPIRANYNKCPFEWRAPRTPHSDPPRHSTGCGYLLTISVTLVVGCLKYH